MGLFQLKSDQPDHDHSRKKPGTRRKQGSVAVVLQTNRSASAIPNLQTDDTAASGPASDCGGAASTVLIVDDQDDARWVLTNLMQQCGFVAVPATNGEDALASIRRHSPSLVLLDIGLPDMDGFEVLARIKQFDKAIPVIMVTGNSNTYDAGRAVRAGAWDYITRPFQNKDVLHTVRCALAEKARKSQVWRIADTSTQANLLPRTMGTSASIRAIQHEVELVARTNFSILVTGESGSGKELVSQAIHAMSLRADKPLIAVDCGAIAENLIESELFGHEKGSFTGAHQAKAGAFELADGGTIFLDEIGNLPLAMQGKLLRVLETRRIHRIGSTREKQLDFRVVAATNANLPEKMARHEFREDLYHRLAEYSIRIPPLRERKDDLVFLTQRFLMQTNAELGKQVKGLSTTAWDIVQRYDWHGNARELRNQLRRAVLLCDHANGLILPDQLGMPTSVPTTALALDAAQPAGHGAKQPHPLHELQHRLADGHEMSLKEIVAQGTAQAERAALEQALARSNGNKAQAARALRIDYKTIHTKLKVYEISTAQFLKTGTKTVQATYEGSPATKGMVHEIPTMKRADEKTVEQDQQPKLDSMSPVKLATSQDGLRDPCITGYERRVGQLAGAIGAELGLDAQRIEGLGVIGYLHDIGKITIPAELLSKPGKVSALEFKLLRRHAQAGYEVLKDVQFPWPVAAVALQHHERMDGSGYPQGLKGEAILFEARIMAVADVVEAMTSDRPYRAALGIEEALAEIESGSGSKYDPVVAQACLNLFRQQSYVIGR